ncbi:MAG TPA: cytidine deaminase [Chiayiivirga sp.]|nr:cytidine deaminase [Chiayiivirga sp.]
MFERATPKLSKHAVHTPSDAVVADTDALCALAMTVARQAYAPYSKLQVGAALRSKAGHVYSGCNVENAAYPLGGCAERGAIAMAVQAEGASFRLAEIAVAAFAEDGAALPVSPCGGCRQALVEFGPDAAVSFRQPDGGWVAVSADALLPWRFVFPEN